MYADKVVDCMGSCISPMLTIEEEMGLIENGQILQVRTDKPDLAETVRTWASDNGHLIEEEERVSGVTNLIIRKGAAPKAEAT